jgi:hypothetical protein
MKFKSLTEEELQMASLVPKGVYDYQVIVAEDKISQAGNEYTSIHLIVWDESGKEHVIFTNMALAKLLKHFCDVNRMQEEYKSEDIPSEKFLMKNGGKVVLDIEGEKPNPKGGFYRAKNIVIDYIASPPGSMMKPLPEVKDNFLNDDLPF